MVMRAFRPRTSRPGFADDRVVALRQRGEQTVDPGQSAGPFDRSIVSPRTALGDVVAQREAEISTRLQDHCICGAADRSRYRARRPVDRHRPRRIVKSRQPTEERYCPLRSGDNGALGSGRPVQVDHPSAPAYRDGSKSSLQTRHVAAGLLLVGKLMGLLRGPLGIEHLKIRRAPTLARDEPQLWVI